MATITWPDDLPQTFERGSYTDNFIENVIRSDFDVGPASLRRRVTQNIFKASGSMFMTTEQWELMIDFLHEETLDRSQVFGFPAQGVTEASPTAEWLVLMAEPPSRSWLADDSLWLVTISFVVLPS